MQHFARTRAIKKCNLFHLYFVFELKNKDSPLPKSSWLGCGRVAVLQVLDGGGALVAQMDEQDVAELAAGAATQRVQDGFVLPHRFTPALPLAGKIRGVANPADPPGEVGVSA